MERYFFLVEIFRTKEMEYYEFLYSTLHYLNSAAQFLKIIYISLLFFILTLYQQSQRILCSIQILFCQPITLYSKVKFQISIQQMKPSRRSKINLRKEEYEDEGINPLEMFKVSTQNSLRSKTSQQLSKVNLNANEISRKTKQNDNYKTFVSQQPSLTEQAMNSEASQSQGPTSINIMGKITKLSSRSNHSNRSKFLKCRLRNRLSKRSQMKQIIHKQKISNIIRNFLQKLRRNNIFSKVIDVQNIFSDEQRCEWLNVSGFEINQSLHRVFEMVLLFINFICIFYYTLLMVFNLQKYSYPVVLERVALFVFLLDFGLSSSTVKVVAGKKLYMLKEILQNYLSESLLIDFSMIVILIVDIFNDDQILNFFKLIIILKIPFLLQKMDKIETHFISTTYKEQYWSLIKLFLFNFCFAHILALALRFMADINANDNWMMKKSLESAPWYEVYIWSYYWAINIMLTVGFGDLVATNYIQALCLIFIETFSCIVLAYNINCVGSLISNIRAQDVEKNKKYKIFRGLAQKNHISNDLSLKIGNYLEESSNIKKKFNIEEEHKFLQNLPKMYKKQYLKQANRSILSNLYFFSNLTEKVVQSLAESIETTISHPEELILSSQNYMHMKILKQGRLGYCCRKSRSIFDNKLIDEVLVMNGEEPILLGVQFMTHRRPIYQIKSLQYSIMYSLPYEKIIQCLHKSRNDYEYFCFLRDKSKHIVDEFQITKCKHCKTKHTPFLCPRLHYIPFKQQVVNKAIYTQKKSKCIRNPIQRISFRKFNPLKNLNQRSSELFKFDSGSNTLQNNNQFLIGELRHIQRLNTDQKQLNHAIFFLNNAAQGIKQELVNFLKRQNYQDQIWIIALDSMQNYKNYFPQSNPSSLKQRCNQQSENIFCSPSSNSFINYSIKQKIFKQTTIPDILYPEVSSQTIPIYSFEQF